MHNYDAYFNILYANVMVIMVMVLDRTLSLLTANIWPFFLSATICSPLVYTVAGQLFKVFHKSYHFLVQKHPLPL